MRENISKARGVRGVTTGRAEPCPYGGWTVKVRDYRTIAHKMTNNPVGVDTASLALKGRWLPVTTVYRRPNRQVRTGSPQAMEGFIHRPAANEQTCIYGKISLMHMSG